MQIDLPPALEAFVKDLIARGHYADEADVVRDALRRMAESDFDQLQQLREALIEGETSGPPRPFDNDAFVARMRAKHAATS
ncbi:MAG: type II toxin-antitoxin system ParD family antitoxin [Terricaulis sp.]|nr:type II toxin-antitoxin system ParD family antitoxin [Terricaulis sp.]